MARPLDTGTNQWGAVGTTGAYERYRIRSSESESDLGTSSLTPTHSGVYTPMVRHYDVTVAMTMTTSSVKTPLVSSYKGNHNRDLTKPGLAAKDTGIPGGNNRGNGGVNGSGSSVTSQTPPGGELVSSCVLVNVGCFFSFFLFGMGRFE